MKRIKPNPLIWGSRSLKFIFLFLYFACVFRYSSGAYPTAPRFVIQNRHCRHYFIHPRDYPNVHEGGQMWLASNIHFNIHFAFDQVTSGKYGYIRHIPSGKVWYADGNARKKGTRIALRNTRNWQALFSIDQEHGIIRHIGGYYVHHKSRSCDGGDEIHLWDDVHHRMRWNFIDPHTHEKVLPYGAFHTCGYWSLIFALHNPQAEHTYAVSYKEGRSLSQTKTDQFTYEWQLSATAKKWFLTVSTSTTLTRQITHSSTSTWYSETSRSHNIKVHKGQSIAVWQRMIKGEQLGNKVVYQTNFFAHTKSRYEQPPDNAVRRRLSTNLKESASPVYYYYVNNTDTIDVNLDESLERKSFNYREEISITKAKKSDTLDESLSWFNSTEDLYYDDDESQSSSNPTEDLNYDDDDYDVFALYDYAIVVEVDTDHDDKEIDNVNQNKNDNTTEEESLKHRSFNYQEEISLTRANKSDNSNQSLSWSYSTEDLFSDDDDDDDDYDDDDNYDDDDVFALYDYVIVDEVDTDHDNTEIDNVNQIKNDNTTEEDIYTSENDEKNLLREDYVTHMKDKKNLE